MPIRKANSPFKIKSKGTDVGLGQIQAALAQNLLQQQQAAALRAVQQSFYGGYGSSSRGGRGGGYGGGGGGGAGQAVDPVSMAQLNADWIKVTGNKVGLQNNLDNALAALNLKRKEAGETVQTQNRQVGSDATARGAYTSQGTRDNFGDIGLQYNNALAGFNINEKDLREQQAQAERERAAQEEVVRQQQLAAYLAAIGAGGGGGGVGSGGGRGYRAPARAAAPAADYSWLNNIPKPAAAPKPLFGSQPSRKPVRRF